MKQIYKAQNNTKPSLLEKNIKIHKRLWKIYFILLLIGITAVFIQGLI